MTPEHTPSSEISNDKQWTLWREDIYGNQFRMPIALQDEEVAVAAQALYTAKGHHQTYATRLMNADDTTDFIACESQH